MKQQEPFADSNMNPYIASQMQQQMPHNAGINNFAVQQDSFPPNMEHPYKSSNVEGEWQRDRDAQNVPNQVPMSAHAFNEGQGGNVTRSYYQGQTLEPILGLENQTNKEVGPQLHEQDMEIGYEENTLSLTFEALEKKFHDEIMKLSKEQNDAEDAENARHREKLIEINSRHQQQLTALRVQHANRRHEFFEKESQERLSQYQQVGISHYQNTGFQDADVYSGAAVTGVAGEVHQTCPTNRFETYQNRRQFSRGGRNQRSGGRAGGRVVYPYSRVHNNLRSPYFQ